MHCAAVNGNTEVVQFLLSHGADVNAIDEFVNVYKTAKDKRIHTLDGNYLNFKILFFFCLHVFHNTLFNEI